MIQIARFIEEEYVRQSKAEERRRDAVPQPAATAAASAPSTAKCTNIPSPDQGVTQPKP